MTEKPVPHNVIRQVLEVTDRLWALKNVDPMSLARHFAEPPPKHLPRLMRVSKGTAIIAVNGVLRRSDYAAIGAAVKEAEVSPAVRQIVFDVDSPGGEVSGVADLADEVRSCAKPTIALANDRALSAAFVLACACREVLCTRTAAIGGLGVVQFHANFFGANQRDGIETREIGSGRHKTDGSPFRPLDPTAERSMRETVNAAAAVLYETVSAYRKIPIGALEAFQGGTRIGKAAVDAGFADRVVAGGIRALVDGKVSKPASKPVVKLAVTPSKPVVKPVAASSKPASKPVVKPVVKPSKPVVKPSKPVAASSKPASKAVAKPVVKPVVKPISRSSKPASKAVAKPVSKPAARYLEPSTTTAELEAIWAAYPALAQEFGGFNCWRALVQRFGFDLSNL